MTLSLRINGEYRNAEGEYRKVVVIRDDHAVVTDRSGNMSIAPTEDDDHPEALVENYEVNSDAKLQMLFNTVTQWDGKEDSLRVLLRARRLALEVIYDRDQAASAAPQEVLEAEVVEG